MDYKGMHIWIGFMEDLGFKKTEVGARRLHKRVISDQQRRRDAALERQKQGRSDLQRNIRQLASVLSEEGSEEEAVVTEEPEPARDDRERGTKLSGKTARSWFSQQFMLPEWLIDVPSHLKRDWFVLPRPAGKRCIVVSSRCTTVSRLRSGRVLHSFASALPNGARVSGIAASAQIFCILDCIFHEADETYYILDMMCWRGYSLYECTTEFRLFWRDSKLAETDVFSPPHSCSRYKFRLVPAYECNEHGLAASYGGEVPYKRDGILLWNRHTHYSLGYTPLALLWKDSSCSEYYIDTDADGNVSSHQQLVLELKEDGSVGTCDDPPVILATLPPQFLQQNGFKPGTMLRFAVGDEGIKIVDGKPIAADIHYQGPVAPSIRPADSCSKIMFQYAARHAPITYQHILSSIQHEDDDAMDVC